MYSIRYLPTNDAWCVATDSGHILTFDRYEPGKRLFPTREELLDALHAIGLQVSRGRVVKTAR